MKIEAQVVDGVPIVVLSEAFNGVAVETDMGLFGIAQRDGGIEVLDVANLARAFLELLAERQKEKTGADNTK